MKKQNIKALVLLLFFLFVLTVPALAADYVSITIDGYMDDWEDKPKTPIFKGNHDEEDELCYTALFSDGEFLYIYLRNSEEKNRDIKDLNLHITINGQSNHKYDLNVKMESDEDFTPISLKKGHVETGYGIYRSDEENQLQRAEIQIPLSFFLSDVDAIDQIMLEVPPWGKQQVPLSGISTDPLVGVALCALIAGSGYLWKKKKRSQLAAK